jgi:hypothetical protein
MTKGKLAALVDGIIAGYQGVPMWGGQRLQAVGFGIRHEPGCAETRPVIVVRGSSRRLHCPSCDTWGVDEVWAER